ncbi:plasmid pRiA4b ORF-3 family protein [Arthrobacter sp. UYCu712]|uniref:plasmid pRiA4b ORF-3 family protein n=1 Tax=Arthrobacter sp. UYCu712 TaxID=3156340 RepID=UPI003395A64C
MTKNSRNKRTGNPAGMGGSGSRASQAPSLSAFRAGRAVDALTPAFVRWLDDGKPGAAASALECLAQVKNVMGRYMERTAAADVTSLDPVPLALAVSDEISAVAAAAMADSAYGVTDDVDEAVYTVNAVHAFVEFLAETGRWSGSEGQLSELRDFFDTLGGDDGYSDGGRGFIDVPDIPDKDALQYLSELALIQRAAALLEWIGDGKPVTATGALRLRDIEAAAACVGVTVRGSTKRAASQPGALLPGFDEAPGFGEVAEPVPTVRSMYEVPLLAQLWNALADSELIEVQSTKAVRSAASDVFVAGGTAERLEELEFFVEQFLESAVLGFDREQPWERLIAGMQASILLAAATPDPPLKERVLAAPESAPEAEKMMFGVLTGVAVSRLEAFAELGLLTIDTHFRVPPALVGCVAGVFDDEWVLSDLGLQPAPDEDVDLTTPSLAASGAAPDAAPTPTAPPADGSILQLKIMLNGSKPPIWRRVLVPSGMPLSQLHRVIQALFGWLDCHLHHFQTAGYRGPTYAPLDPDGEDDFYGESSLDEAKVSVGELLPAVGSGMTYTYDFGDNWVHAVKVEKVLPADGGGQLPRCTAGRGAAPAEDSGGTWGWADIVEAVNDPRHEEHKEYREWLGMKPGDTLDPKAFDPDEVNQELADHF